MLLVDVAKAGHCVHRCVYCYASEYRGSWDGKGAIKVYGDVVEKVKAELKRLKLCPQLYISPASDPFQPVDEVIKRSIRLTEFLLSQGLSFHHVTKSHLVKEVLNLGGLVTHPYYRLQMTVETLDPVKAKVLSSAPSPELRLECAEAFSKEGMYVVLRADPIIYGFTSDFEELRRLLLRAKEAGVKWVVCSTGRFRNDTLLRLIKRLKDAGYEKEAEVVKNSYVEEESGFYRLPVKLRLKFHKVMKVLTESLGLGYSVCQELGWRRGLDTQAICCGSERGWIMVKRGGRWEPLCNRSCALCITASCGFPELLGQPINILKLRKLGYDKELDEYL